MKIELLDCTVRDGGYNNDWNFGHNALISIFERVVSAEVDFIELGFLDQRRPFDINRSIMPNTECMQKIYGKLDKKRTKTVGMIDFGTCDLSNIQPAKDTCLDGIRVIFKKHLREPAMAFCKQLKDMGYIVFSQLVSITSYTDEELMDLIRMVNDVKPYAVSMVDTYGLLHKNNLFHYYELLDKYVDPSVAVGYHSHNNFQLAYANSIELINNHKGKGRTLLCDGSLFGMGKGAGNAPIELLCMYMNDNYDKHYHISQLLEAIDSTVLDLYNKYHWGYSMKAFIAASNDCHPNYVSYLLDKKTLSVKSINDILKNLVGDKKLLYDKNYIEQLYIDYQRIECADEESYRQLTELLKDKDVLVLGPGTSITTELDKVIDYVKEKHPFVISINYLSEKIPTDGMFITNSKRYNQQVTAITEIGDKIVLIATSNLTRTHGKFDYTVDYESLIDRDAVFMDNSFIMMLKVLVKSGVKHVALAGFDGYSPDTDNYYVSQMEYDFAKRMGQEINEYVNKMLPALGKQIAINFVTSTLYQL